jgi:hypothetical protein
VCIAHIRNVQQSVQSAWAGGADAERSRRDALLLELASATPETLEATIAAHRAAIDEALLQQLYDRIQVAQRFEEVRG